jgi:hypothetical protein
MRGDEEVRTKKKERKKKAEWDPNLYLYLYLYLYLPNNKEAKFQTLFFCLSICLVRLSLTNFMNMDIVLYLCNSHVYMTHIEQSS